MALVTNQVFYATTYHPIQAGSIDGTDTAAHDNAVYRALLASSTGLYDPLGDLKAEGDPYCTLFVGRLARHTTEESLKLVMSKYGNVKHIRLVRHIVTGASQGYAFVEFETEKEMFFAYEAAHYNVIDGSQIIVDYNRQQLMPGWIPRRLGGGLGGRKESGQLRFGGRDRPFRAPLRLIPKEQLTKLGIPLPPVGRYMSRFLVPPIPRRPNMARETHRHRSSRKDLRRGSPHLESKVTDKRVMERVLSQSPEKPWKGGEELGDGTNLSRRHKKAKHAVDLDGGSYDLSNKVRRYDGEKSHRNRTDYLSEAVDTRDYHGRVRRHDAEKSHGDRRIYEPEAADEKDEHERARGHDSEKSERYQRDYQSEASDEKDFREQRYSSETSTARYDTSAEQELPSPGYEGRSKSSQSQDWRDGRRSRENTDYQTKSEEYERSSSKHSQEKRERKRSRSRERTRTSRYEEDSSKSRHGREGREHKRRHSKPRSGET